MSDAHFKIFLACLPGLEPVLADEARALGLPDPVAVPGGVETSGDWPAVWRANLWLRGASRVLVRIGEFRAMHLAQLDKRARKFPWGDFLRADVAIKVDAICARSKIYHKGAAAQRVERAIAETVGAPIDAGATLRLMVRIEDDLVTLSLDTSGEGLHKRGHKLATGKAPLRETMAALFLAQMGYDGTQPVLDPMCGSGTFVIEAAEIAAGLAPGRTRSFAFEQFASFNPSEWKRMRASPSRKPPLQFFGFDRDDGAIRGARGNAERAGIAGVCRFERQAVSDLMPPEGMAPGIVLTNPPYGARIGERKLLFAVYGALGATLKARFSGWRVGIVTPDRGLAQATGLALEPLGPVDHSGTKVWLWQGVVA